VKLHADPSIHDVPSNPVTWDFDLQVLAKAGHPIEDLNVLVALRDIFAAFSDPLECITASNMTVTSGSPDDSKGDSFP
jgi:hypothetical protein